MKLCAESEIDENCAKGFVINRDEQVFIIRKDNQLYVYENRCPHLGIPLEMLPDQFFDIDKKYIQCSTHGALFQIHDGYCIAGPCSGASLKPRAFEISDGDIHLLAD